MAMAQDARLKQLMVYRLEEQLRVISQEDTYSQVLAVLARCVQSLLVPKKERGHDGSGDATTVDPFATLDELLLGADRDPSLPSKEKLLVLLADSLSVVFATIDDLKPGPVSHAYLNNIYDEEQAIASKTKQVQDQPTSSASLVITHLSASTDFTDSLPNTVSAAQSSASGVSMQQQQSWGQQPAAVAAPTPVFGTQQQATGFGAGVPSLQQPQQQASGFGTQARVSQQQQAPSTPPSNFGGMQQTQQPQQESNGFGGGYAPRLQGFSGAPQNKATISASQSPSSTLPPPSFGTKSTNLSTPPPHQRVQHAAPTQSLGQPNFGAQQQQQPAAPTQSFGQHQSFGASQQQAPAPTQNFGDQSSQSWGGQQPQQQQQATAPTQSFGGGQSSQGWGAQQPQQQQAAVPTQSFGGQQPPQSWGGQQPQQQQQATAPTQSFGGGQSSQGWGAQQPQQQQQAAAPTQSFGGQQPQQQQAPAPTQSFNGGQSAQGWGQQQQQADASAFKVPELSAAPSFGTQSTGNMQQPQQQQQGGLLQIDPAYQQKQQSGFGSSPAGDAPKTEEWSQMSSADSGIGMGQPTPTSMGELKVETDGGGMYKLPIKLPQESPQLIATGPEPRLEDWADYNPVSNFGTYVIPDRPARGGFRGSSRGGNGGGRGGYDGGRGRGRGGF